MWHSAWHGTFSLCPCFFLLPSGCKDQFPGAPGPDLTLAPVRWDHMVILRALLLPLLVCNRPACLTSWPWRGLVHLLFFSEVWDAQDCLSSAILLLWPARPVIKIAFCYAQSPVPFCPLVHARSWVLTLQMKTSDLSDALSRTAQGSPSSLFSAGWGEAYLPFLIWERKNSIPADSPRGNMDRHFPCDLFSFIFKFIFTGSIGIASLN